MSLDIQYARPRRSRRDTPTTIPAPTPTMAELNAECAERLRQVEAIDLYLTEMSGR